MIRRLLVPAPARVNPEALTREFPALRLVAEAAAGAASDPVVHVNTLEWEIGEPDFFALDTLVGDAGGDRGLTLRLSGSGDLTRAAIAVLTRLQWAIPLQPRPDGALLARVRRRHHALHDLGRPLVHADWLHALDTQHWVARLEEEPGADVLIAALFHDVERLASEADVRVEHLAADYDAFKRDHAAAGARLAREALADLLSDAMLRRVEHLVERHETPDGDPVLVLLNDADALSFFSRNVAGFLRWFGEGHTRKKVGWTLARMSSRARMRLPTIRLPSAIAAMVEDAGARPHAPDRAEEYERR